MPNKKDIASKMYSTSRCGKCNRFGHSHEKCTKLEKKIDSFVSRNKGAGKQTKYLEVHPFHKNERKEDMFGDGRGDY